MSVIWVVLGVVVGGVVVVGLAVFVRHRINTVAVMNARITLSTSAESYSEVSGHVLVESADSLGDMAGMEAAILGVWYASRTLWLMGSRAGDRAPHDYLLLILEAISALNDDSPEAILESAGLPAVLGASPPTSSYQIDVVMRAPRAMPFLMVRHLGVSFGMRTPEPHLVASVPILLAFVRSRIDAEAAKVLWAALRIVVLAEAQGLVSRSYADFERVSYSALSDAVRGASDDSGEQRQRSVD